MKNSLMITFQMLALSIIAATANAAPVSIDGVLGAEWTGSNVVHVLNNPSAPTSNFGSPTNENATGAYDIHTRGDASYLYVGLSTLPSYAGGLDFANLYFDTQHTGSTIGLEVTNNRAFIPGVSTGGPANDGYYPYTAGGSDIHFALTPGGGAVPSVLEVAVPWSVFTNNTLGLNTLPLAASQVRLNLSQSFGISVAGGQAFYGDTRLGEVTVPVPEPTSIALMGLAAAGSLAIRRRR